MPTARLARTAAPTATAPAALPLGGLLTLAATAFTAALTELLPAGLLPDMGGGLGVSQGRVGFLVTLYAAASFLSAIPLTALLRGLPRRTVLIGALTGLALADAVTALSSSYVLTCAARLLAGAMGGTLWAMLAGYGARMVPAERRGRAIAIVLAGITVALSLGVPLGTALAGTVGWRAGFAALALLAALLILSALRYVPDFPGEPSAGRTPLRRIAALPGLRSILSVTLLLLLGHQAMYTFLVPFAEHAGFGRAGLVLFVFGAATVGGIWLAGVLADRRLRAALLCALALIALVMAALGALGRVPAVLVVAVALWGAAFGGAPTLIQTALVDVSGPEHADVATSLQATVYNVGIAAGSLTGGVVLENAGAGALPWTALPLVIGAVLMVWTARTCGFPVRRRVR
ncbi:MFS transporter [Streptomyces sp. TLI_146]|uniref:MFS transporter n=1 Tax=Streptomyces sp. TLI_146 TaxID=1938858 RepID=UPI000C7081EA|nr:MFS transporter [Streptomyces sp. TLI_146]PKV83961.1 putative MFS family arabinose efflux permease [Streptomyces sp. TLI_146]